MDIFTPDSTRDVTNPSVLSDRCLLSGGPIQHSTKSIRGGWSSEAIREWEWKWCSLLCWKKSTKTGENCGGTIWMLLNRPQLQSGVATNAFRLVSRGKIRYPRQRIEFLRMIWNPIDSSLGRRNSPKHMEEVLLRKSKNDMNGHSILWSKMENVQL